MRLDEFGTSFRASLGNPLAWISVATFGGIFGCMSLLALRGHGLHSPALWAATLAGPLAASFGYGFLSGMPWQWSGDGRPLAPLPRGFLQSLLAALVFLAGLHLMDRALHAVLLHQPFRARWAPVPYLFQTPFLVLVGLFIALGQRGDRERQQAQSSLQEAQWILLRAQLSPHVLFNTLNALAELARRDPEATERAMLDLSDLYERLIHHGERLLAPLADERAVLERYLSLHALRLGRRLEVAWDWGEGLDAFQLPPLLLQPLVENALKHGIAPASGGGLLRISGRREGGRLLLEVANTGRAPGAPAPGRTGLRNLEERLRLAYGGQASFTLGREGDWTRARLDLPEGAWKT